MKYKQAYDKIIDAYFRDEIKPYDLQFCFCGTLAIADPRRRFDRWNYATACNYSEQPYSKLEFQKMEAALLVSLGNKSPSIFYWDGLGIDWDHPDYENRLFIAMSAALDVLKEIHRSRGENVDEELTPFTKRTVKPLFETLGEILKP